MGITLKPFIQGNGTCPFNTWFNGLNALAAVRVRTALARLEGGNTAAVKWFNGIGEIRIDWGPGYRVYVLKDGERLILLLGGGTKRRQSTDIERALKLRDEYSREKAAQRDKRKDR